MRGWWTSSTFLVFGLAFLLGGCQPSGSVQQTPEDTPQCVAMQPGSVLPFQTRFGNLPARYALSKAVGPQGELIFTAEVPVRFLPADPIPVAAQPHSQISQDALISEVWKKTTQCLDSVQPYLRGPQGEYLRIVLQDGALLGASNSRQIRVTTNPYIQGHSEYWTTAWGCHQILHEIMHLVGLVDAYADTNYNCRAQGPSDAIMVAPERAFLRVGLPLQQGQAWAPSLLLQGGSPSAAGSLLYPAEFQAVIAPHCSESQLYGQCAANAYRSQSFRGCAPAPEACSQPQIWYSGWGTL